LDSPTELILTNGLMMLVSLANEILLAADLLAADKRGLIDNIHVVPLSQQ
jgi:hypothetical protein